MDWEAEDASSSQAVGRQTDRQTHVTRRCSSQRVRPQPLDQHHIQKMERPSDIQSETSRLGRLDRPPPSGKTDSRGGDDEEMTPNNRFHFGGRGSGKDERPNETSPVLIPVLSVSAGDDSHNGRQNTRSLALPPVDAPVQRKRTRSACADPCGLMRPRVADTRRCSSTSSPVCAPRAGGTSCRRGGDKRAAQTAHL
ncbi:hypothetical protein EYF80_040693 [Liparis tanakae]|uniref:Uncharacterized protein n=1 Tax=Liparis tanakae TaxID=230148 RepID=A0A4Z2G688_9TELE|nr:hypothetical protein EYF80_040693 [Liparis tanakae]